MVKITMTLPKKIKNCKYCNIELTLDNACDVRIKAHGPTIVSRLCKPCRSKESYEWVKKNHEYVYAYHKKYLLAFQTKKTKLTKEKVLMIRKLKQKGMTIKDIALKFQVSPSRISNIIAKRAWKNI
jgi:YesN/AraC family two-component response regulator